jgi:hypothetical protein
MSGAPSAATSRSSFRSVGWQRRRIASFSTRGGSAAAARAELGVNRRFTGTELAVVGVVGAVLGAVVVGRGVGLLFWVVLGLFVVAVGVVVFDILGLVGDFRTVPLEDRWRNWRAERYEARWLHDHPAEAAERWERMRPMREWEEALDAADETER